MEWKARRLDHFTTTTAHLGYDLEGIQLWRVNLLRDYLTWGEEELSNGDLSNCQSRCIRRLDATGVILQFFSAPDFCKKKIFQTFFLSGRLKWNDSDFLAEPRNKRNWEGVDCDYGGEGRVRVRERERERECVLKRRELETVMKAKNESVRIMKLIKRDWTKAREILKDSERAIEDERQRWRKREE